MQGYYAVFLRIILERTSVGAHVYMWRHQGGKFEHYNISIVIYHKYSHGTASYRLNGEDAHEKSYISA